jgi:3-phenylpropionate/cinnamic acid dioxygenase small subunit
VTNVRVERGHGDEVQTTAWFLVYRIRQGQAGPYVGRYEHVLRRTPAGWRIAYRRAVLDQEALTDHGVVSIIL